MAQAFFKRWLTSGRKRRRVFASGRLRLEGAGESSPAVGAAASTKGRQPAFRLPPSPAGLVAVGGRDVFFRR